MSAKSNLPAKLPPVSTEIAERRKVALEKAEQIDQVASMAMAHMGSPDMAAELQVAQAMADLRALLTPEVMAPIMALADTDLGFRTDRDPRQINSKTGQPNTPYPVEVVRDVVIEAKLRGFRTIGNEFNLIAGRFYAAKNGFRRKLTDGKSFPGLSNFRDSYDVPRISDRGAIVKCRASWTLNGKADSFEAEFAIRVNAMMGADAILGKAERKLCKRIHDLLSGVNTPDGDAGEEVDLTPEATKAPPAPSRFTRPTPAARAATSDPDDQIPGAEFPANPIPNDKHAEGGTDTAPATDPAVSGEPGNPQGGGSDPAPAAGPGPAGDPDALTPEQAELASFVEGLGKSFDDFQKAIVRLNWFPGADSWASFGDIPATTVARLLRAKHGLRNELTKGGGAA